MLNSKWFNGRETDEEKKDLERSVRNAKYTLDLLSQIIEREIKELSKTKFDDYDNPGWQFKRCDRDGQIRALQNVLKLTTLEPQKVSE